METVDRLLLNATCLLPNDNETSLKSVICDVAIKDGKIYDLGRDLKVNAAVTENLQGLHLLPGVIDSQVHFREPGLTHKEDLETGSLGALFGGVTSYFEMPNTSPSTITKEAFQDKLTRAQGRSYTHYAFYVGACAENAEELGTLEKLPHCSGVKMFMGSSTGSLLVDSDAVLETVMKSGTKRIIVHSEDEQRLRQRKHLALESANPLTHPIWRDVETAMISTRKVTNLAQKYQRPLHVLHVSTADEMEYLKNHKPLVTVEVLPQHLTLFAPDCYERLGTLAQQNPPIRDRHHLEGLWKGIANGTVDVIGSDHAPHTLDEKALPYPSSPSGVPGVQTLIPIMLHHVNQGRLSLEKFAELVTLNPRRVFKIADKGILKKGYDADLTILDLKKTWTLENSWIKSRSQWTPFAGMKIQGSIHSVYLMGTKVLQEDELITPPAGKAVNFN